MKYLITTLMPEDYDSDNVHWQDDQTGKVHGKGYRGKDDGKIGLIRCPECDVENYAMAVRTGICYACGFNANQLNTPTNEKK